MRLIRTAYGSRLRPLFSLRILFRAGVVLILAGCAIGPVEPVTRALPVSRAEAPPIPKPAGEVLRVASLNMAHGRKDGFSQIFFGESTIRANLDDIADTLRRHAPDLVALQEADAPSWWSGGFDHVGYIAERAAYPWYLHATNVDGWFATYGTALLSRLPLADGLEHTFAASPPTPSKGLVLASFRWPLAGGGSRIVDVVSVHLDFSRRSVREAQIRELKALLDERMNPTIIMGDFNSDWLNEGSVIEALARDSRFVAHAPADRGLASYGDKRLDWILITRDLAFVDYRVLDDVLSDHAMLLAEIRLGSQEARRGDGR